MRDAGAPRCDKAREGGSAAVRGETHPAMAGSRPASPRPSDRSANLLGDKFGPLITFLRTAASAVVDGRLCRWWVYEAFK